MNQTTCFRGTLLLNESLAAHTSWRVGGPAERFYQPADLQDLADFLAAQPASEPLFWMGLGSNLLVRDGGVRGAVVCTTGRLKRMERINEQGIHVQAGVPCAHMARFGAEHGLGGAEFLAGIPGTLGGALAMNAGAFGGEIWPLVETVQMMDRFGNLTHRRPQDFQVGYRSVQIPQGEWFVSADLRLNHSVSVVTRQQIRELLAKRAASQPLHQPSCGSVFRNPPGDHAARLIEACGLKGYTLGGAQVSEKHANFIINTGTATAHDLETLINLVRSRVEEVHGVLLEPEVRIVGVSTAQT